MTKWKVPSKKRGQHATTVSLRVDPIVALAVTRLVHRDANGRLVSRSSIYTAGALKLPEVREEISKIKQERRGAKTRTTGVSGQR